MTPAEKQRGFRARHPEYREREHLRKKSAHSKQLQRRRTKDAGRAVIWQAELEARRQARLANKRTRVNQSSATYREKAQLRSIRRAALAEPVVAIAYGNCAYCGRLFVFRACVPQVYCQQSHAHRAGKRRFVPRGMTRRQIYERDGWRCHVCHRRVPDRPYRALDLDPTLDHLIPVADGGTDHPSNLALAHNKCNWDRGRGGVAQLRLIA